MIDTHTHIYEEVFDADRTDVVARATSAGVSHMLLPATSEDDMQRVHDICAQYPSQLLPLYGLHPTELKANPMEQVEKILDFADHHTPLGIGEIGLDLHWDKSRLTDQTEAFLAQMRYAYDHSLPVSIHCREAISVLIDILPRLEGHVPQGSLHCFDGSPEQAKQIHRKYPQLMFGFGGSCTYKNSRVAEVALAVPLSTILTETDAPYLTPVPHRGKRNEPSYIPLIVNKIAETLGLAPEEVAERTDHNARQLFGIK